MSKDKSPSSELKHNFKKFWNYLWHDDSLGSYVLNFMVALVFIKFIFFPTLGLLLGTDIPVVAVVSGSMEHKVVDGNVCSTQLRTDETYGLSLSSWWEYCGEYYEDNFNLKQEDFEGFPFTNGLNTGDVVILKGKEPKDILVGDVLVFVPGDLRWYAQNGPVIHRVVEKSQVDGEYVFTTKGDHNPQVAQGNFETNITEDQILAVASFRIPYVGYLKVWLTRILGVIF